MIQIKTIIILSHLLVTFGWGDPQEANQIAVTQWDGGTIWIAHSHLAGGLFHEISLGDSVHVVDEAGELIEYVVTQQGEYLFVGAPTLNGLLWVGDQKLRRTEVVKLYSDPRGIVLVTCYPRYGTTTGQRVLKLLPKELFAGGL